MAAPEKQLPKFTWIFYLTPKLFYGYIPHLFLFKEVIGTALQKTLPRERYSENWLPCSQGLYIYLY